MGPIMNQINWVSEYCCFTDTSTYRSDQSHSASSSHFVKIILIGEIIMLLSDQNILHFVYLSLFGPWNSATIPRLNTYIIDPL